jgi:hypothetical protein
MRIPQSLAPDFFKIAIDTRNLELKLFWQRSIFFAGFIAAIFIGYYSTKAGTTPGSNVEILQALLLILGAFFSLAWCLANRGSKYWYESWEKKVSQAEEILGAEFFDEWIKPEQKSLLYTARLYSVSKLAIFLSDLVFLAWIVLISIHFATEPAQWFTEWRVSLLIIPLALILWLLLVKTRTTVPPNVLNEWKKK